VKTGLIAMVPNLSPVFLTLGVMGWFGLALDYIRLLIASVAIGISVDDTIHLVTRLLHEFRRYGNYERALHEAMADVGRALFITSGVLTLGFLVLLFSAMDSLVRFGALLAGTIVMALIADFFLMPALVLTLKPFGPEAVDSEQERPGAAAAAAG
jgi:predicted RND superfamily exporter protein